MDRLWEMLKKVKRSATSYRSNYFNISSEGSFSVKAEAEGNTICFTEEGEVRMSDGSLFSASNYILWKRREEGIEFHRRRMGGYEKLFEIDENGRGVSPHT